MESGDRAIRSSFSQGEACEFQQQRNKLGFLTSTLKRFLLCLSLALIMKLGSIMSQKRNYIFKDKIFSQERTQVIGEEEIKFRSEKVAYFRS